MSLRPTPSAVSDSLAALWPAMETNMARVHETLASAPWPLDPPPPREVNHVKVTTAEKLADLPIGGRRIIYSAGPPTGHIYRASRLSGGRFVAQRTADPTAWIVERKP